MPRGHSNIKPGVQLWLPLVYKETSHLEVIFSSLSRNPIVRMLPALLIWVCTSWNRSYPGEVSRKCLFFISELVFFFLKKHKRKTRLLFKEAKNTKYVKLKVNQPHPCHRPISPCPGLSSGPGLTFCCPLPGSGWARTQESPFIYMGSVSFT